MPFKIEGKKPPYRVVNAETGRVMGTHETMSKAQAQLAALYANGAADDRPRRRKN